MTVHIGRTSLAVCALTAMLALAGCSVPARPVGAGVPGTPAVAATSAVSTSPDLAAPGASSGASASGGSAAAGTGRDVTAGDLAAIKKQLDAMQSELDSLKMPSDDDFSGAEGAVY